MKLLPHQAMTVQHARRANANGHGTCLFHIMGSGKTVTALAICQALFPTRKIVVYAPSYLESTWRRELADVDPKRSLTVGVFSHEALRTKDQADAKKHKDAIVIIDEVHSLLDMISNNPGVFRFLRGFHRAYLLSGTPIRHSLDEIGRYVNIVAKKTVVPGSLSGFEKQFMTQLTPRQKVWNNWIVRTVSSVVFQNWRTASLLWAVGQDAIGAPAESQNVVKSVQRLDTTRFQNSNMD